MLMTMVIAIVVCVPSNASPPTDVKSPPAMTIVADRARHTERVEVPKNLIAHTIVVENGIMYDLRWYDDGSFEKVRLTPPSFFDRTRSALATIILFSAPKL